MTWREDMIRRTQAAIADNASIVHDARRRGALDMVVWTIAPNDPRCVMFARPVSDLARPKVPWDAVLDGNDVY